MNFVLLLFALVLLLVRWHFKDKKRYAKYPPGPPRVPILGSLPFIPNSPFPSIAFQKMSEKYGDVIHLKMGMINAVVFNSYEAVREILTHENAAARKHDLSMVIKARVMNRNLGIAFSSFTSQEVMRTFTIRTLRKFGFGKTASMDMAINEELDKLMSALKSQIAQSPDGIPGQNLFDLSMVNILWRLVTGKNYEFGNPKIMRLLRLSESMVQINNLAFEITHAFPFLWDLFPRWFGKEAQLKITHEMQDFAKETIREHRESGRYKEDPQCFVDAFLAKIDESEGDPESEFIDDQLLICLLDLFQAGSESSSKTLSYVMLYMLLYPSVQEKVRLEVEVEIGDHEDKITFDMKSRLPYTYATLLECLRWSSIVPFPPPRMATDDFYFNGYFIPKGAPLLVNIQAANYSKTEWFDPYNFRPERFLTAEGALDTKVASRLASFGDGKRVCLGQSLGEASMFIYFATLLRRFELRKVEGETLSHVPIPGMIYAPQPFKIKFVEIKSKTQVQ